MKNLISIILISIFLFGCENEDDFYKITYRVEGEPLTVDSIFYFLPLEGTVKLNQVKLPWEYSFYAQRSAKLKLFAKKQTHAFSPFKVIIFQEERVLVENESSVEAFWVREYSTSELEWKDFPYNIFTGSAEAKL